MRGRYSFLITLAAALFMSACQTPDIKHADNNSITGAYALVKIDGTLVPGKVGHDGFPLNVSSGAFTISADGTCLSTMVFKPPGGNAITREASARYEFVNSQLVMKWKGAGITKGTVAGDTFVMDNHGMIFEYKRKWD